MTADLFRGSGAVFSSCGAYRYRLWRIWNPALKPLNLLMLNPSTADEAENDPTVERCERRADMLGFGGLIVTNLYALRSTDPKVLYTHDDPIGTDNDAAIIRAALDSGAVICGWGAHGPKVIRGRPGTVLHYLNAAGVRPMALKVNGDGSPQHPLYLAYELQPQPYEVAA